MSHNIELKEGAFVVADAHYSHLRPQLLVFIKAIHSKKLQPTQLIFLGDMFDTLFGEIPYTAKINQEAIELLNAISKEIELIYLEGNHDFNLTKIFPHAKIFGINQQPLACGYENRIVMLAHGDFDGNRGYKIYTSLIRNHFVLLLLGAINFISNNFILDKLDVYLSKKNDCREFVGFETFIAQRLSRRFKCDTFIEGHFHQNKSVQLDNFRYINLGAFACNQRYFIVKSSTEVELLEEKIFFKDR